MTNTHSEFYVKRAERLANYALSVAGLLIAGAASLLIYYFNHSG